MAKLTNDAGITKGLAVLALVAVAAILTGCGGGSTSGPQRTVGMGGTVLKDKTDMAKLKDLVAATTAALNDMIADPQRDLKPQYKAFTSALGKLDAMAKKTRDRGVALQASLDKYVDARREEVVTIQDEKLRQQALDRVAQARESFKKLDAQLTTLKEALTPFMGNLKDIQRYLNTDLTPTGLKTIQAMASKVMASDKNIQQLVDGVVAELASVAEELTAGQQKTEK